MVSETEVSASGSTDVLAPYMVHILLDSQGTSYQRYNNIYLMIKFTIVQIQASLSRFVIVTQVMSSQNKEGEVRTESPVPITCAVNVERPDCSNPHETNLPSDDCNKSKTNDRYGLSTYKYTPL